ncbi:MAG TPA: TonB-dependent receptor [Vicinamibacterales bacterium]|nr:TonB-dependent receptor [Vicinamibacterales bacterium]
MRICCALLLLVITVTPGSAQSDSATLTVAVLDASGASVPGATVLVRNLDTAASRDAVSGSDGRTAFALLPPGRYEAVVSLQGFKQFRDTGLRLQVAQSALLEARLDVGDLSEAVEVTAGARLLNIDSVAQGTVITEEKVQALPLNGRQFIQLALLVPGANAGGRAVQQNAVRPNQVGGLSIAGGRTNNTAFLLDGATNTDPDYNSLNYSPSIDAIAEFQVQTAQFSAEYGRAGGQVNVVTKSGGARMRGSLFEYHRNKHFDSKPFNLVGELPEFRRDNFGGSLGGPAIAGRLYFFGSYEQLRRREGAASLTTVTVPTALERDGDFSQSPGGGVFDPGSSSNNRTQFPGNVIPRDRLQPLALAALRALPLPNSGARGYVNTEGVLSQDIYNYSLRFDLNLAQGNRLFGRFSTADENAIVPEVVPGRDNLAEATPRNVVLGWTSVLGSRAVNEARAGYNDLSLTSGLPELSFDVAGQTQSLPRFIVAGYPTIGGAGAFTGTTGGGIVNVRNRVYQVYDNFTWSAGAHTFKTGGEVLWTEYNRTEAPSALGTYQFTAGYTSRTAANDSSGHALASFLLGQPQVASRAVGPSTIEGRQPYFSAYVQDDWRLGDRTTLNLGIRYELAPPMYDADGRMASIDYRNVPSPQQIFAEGRTGFYAPLVFVCGQAGYPKGCAYTDKDNIAPRAGVVFRAAEQTVIRAGAGIYYAASDANPLFRLAAGIPGNIAQTVTYNNFVPARPPGLDVFGAAILGPVQVQQAGIDLFQENSESYQWSANLQHELARDWVVEAGYVGTRARFLEQNVQPNNARPGSGAFDPRRPFAALQFAPGTVFPDYVVVQGDRVPVGFINYLSHTARSDYDGLVTRVEKRLSNGLSLLSAYTLSRARSNAPQFRNAGGINGSENSPPQDSFDLEAEWGPAYYDARHRWVTSGTARLPLALHVSGIFTMQSGFPFTVNLRGDTAGVGAGTGGIFVRPNAVAGVDPYLRKSEWKNGRYLNPAAFAAPAAGAFGSIGRNSLVGPGYINLDLALARGFAVGRIRLDVRAEAFNITNRRNYTLVGRILNDATFGRLISQADPRQWQFGARLTF